MLAATVLCALASLPSLRGGFGGSAGAKTAVAALALTALYAASLQAPWPGFRTATAAYVLALGLLLARGLDLRRVAPPLAAAAVAMSLGLHYVFTNLLVIDLP